VVQGRHPAATEIPTAISSFSRNVNAIVFSRGSGRGRSAPATIGRRRAAERYTGKAGSRWLRKTRRSFERGKIMQDMKVSGSDAQTPPDGR
jgi:hypothetical protein